MTIGDNVVKPWGGYRILDRGPGFQVKRLTLNAGAAISSQSHQHRSEQWVVAVGTADANVGGAVSTLGPGEALNVPRGAIHRLRNPTTELLEVIEVQYGDDLSEADIIRYEDMYGRV